MKSRPILFSDPMVQAILEGRKTQTRRIVKQRDIDWIDEHQGFREPDNAIRCPYGELGDRLWVREAWYCDHWNVQKGPYLEVPGAKDLLYYRATDCDGSGSTYTGFSGETMCNPWRPSIHMPRWASRITLEIVNVRVEKLQDISERDAWAEGCEGFDDDVTGGCSGYGEYAKLWEQINGAGSWDANPWVWVVEFKRVGS